MKADNSKNGCREKTLKVISFPQRDEYVPSIRVAGKWLKKLGFVLGDEVVLVAAEGKILITKKEVSTDIVSAICGYEDMGLALQSYAASMVNHSGEIKLVLCLVDGVCNDAELGKEICRSLRGKVEVIGILLDPDDYTKGYVVDMFGEDRVIACRSEELPRKLGNILRAIRGI